MPDFTVLEISDVEGQKALYPAVFSAPNVVSSYESIDIVFPNTLGSSGEVDISDSNFIFSCFIADSRVCTSASLVSNSAFPSRLPFSACERLLVALSNEAMA